jgi:hypothetical protein
MKIIMLLIMLLGRDHTTTTDQYDADSIHNPENREYVEEIAFNEEIAPEAVTQEMFNARYK